jgi:alkanesulfonate monooxygenase SsuD/methylene tetrahydromethanopterin reductase-like flavin-dependent oxidoreductase (luciferase family)
MFVSPGSYPDKPLADVVDWYLKVVRKADELGYSEFWIGSHVTSRWARIAAPQQIIAQALACTSRIRLGAAVEVLYQQNPITLAVALGQLDQLARGRLMFGFGAGGPFTDLEAFAIPGNGSGEKHAVAHEMMLEAIAIIENCWREGGPDDFEGRFWRMRRPAAKADSDEYAWHLKPYAPVDGRIAVAGFSAKSASLGLAGERGYLPLSWSVSKEFADIQWATLMEGAARTGRTPSRQDWRQVQMIYVADSDREARSAIIDGFAGTFFNKYWEPIFRGTGVMSYLLRRAGKSGSTLTPAELIDYGIWCVGTPDRVAERLNAQIEAYGGFGTLLQVGFDYAGAGEAGWMRSMELLAREVMPRLKAAHPALEGASA